MFLRFSQNKVLVYEVFLKVTPLICERVDISFQIHRFLHGSRGATGRSERLWIKGFGAQALDKQVRMKIKA